MKEQESVGRSVGEGERDPIPPASRPGPVRFEFLDGLRGLTALYVVLHHAAWQAFVDDILIPGRPILKLFFGPLIYTGHLAVAIFIVLSGFCLMLPVAGSDDRRLRGGFRRFLFRRARRILPPYYATILATLILVALVPGLQSTTMPRWADALPVFSAEAILPHAFLIQNLNPGWAYKIDPPLWSVATEWQIYFLFPVLLAIWRRAGMVLTVLAAIGLGLLPSLVRYGMGIEEGLSCCFWYLGLFAMGMAAADLCLSTDPKWAGLRDRFPWMLAAFGVSVLGAISWKLRLHARWIDSLVGAASFCVIVSCAVACQRSSRSWIRDLLELRPCVALGGFSYSLYLTHFPVLAALDLLLPIGAGSLDRRITLTFLAILPACLLVAYLFYLAFERPFFPSKLTRPSTALTESHAAAGGTPRQ